MTMDKAIAGKGARLAFVTLVAMLILAPTAHLVVSAFFSAGPFDWQPTLTVLSEPGTLSALVNTVIYVCGVSLISALVGVPLAFLTERTDIPWVAKRAIRLSVISVLVTPAFLVAMAYVNLIGPNAGVINVALRGLLGLTTDRGPFDVYNIVCVLLLGSNQPIAFVYLIASAAFSNMNPEFEEAAAISGAGRRQIITTVTLPLVRNSIFAGAFLALAGALADYGTPHMIGFNVLTLRIRSYMLDADFTGASVVALVLVCMSLIILGIYRASLGKGGVETITGKSFHPMPFRIGRAKIALSAFAYLYALLAVILPIFGLASTSLMERLGFGFRLDNLTLNHYADAILSDNFVLQAVGNSLVLGCCTAIICLVLAAFTAYMTVRRRTTLSVFLDYVAVIPLGIAGTALAVALVMTVTNFPLRSFGLYGTLWILLIAYVIRQIPVAVRPAQASLMQISTELEEAARLSGASWLRTMWTIVVPLIRPGLIAGAILVFLHSITEISASIILRHIGTQTVSTAIMDLWDGGGGYQRASAVAVVVFLSMVLFVAVIQFATGRSLYQDGGGV